ncbi:hypothetical protein [Actinacidiphila sp. bgisy160]|uniref:hypothetical protein n=1 Tax=Actinacidiphila sp. bgisy160 TaxID=3413796 RepID=UPI003D710F5A
MRRPRGQQQIKDKGWGIDMTTWQSDWPSPAGFLRPLPLPSSPSNYARLDDREINSLRNEADPETDRKAADDRWRTVDSTAQDRGTPLPFPYDRRLSYRSDRPTNAYVHRPGRPRHPGPGRQGLSRWPVPGAVRPRRGVRGRPNGPRAWPWRRGIAAAAR